MTGRVAELQLHNRIERYLQEVKSTGRPPRGSLTVDLLADNIRERFAEYKRRPFDSVRHQVDRALSKYLSSHPDDTSLFLPDDDASPPPPPSLAADSFARAAPFNATLRAAYSPHTPGGPLAGASADTAIPIDLADTADTADEESAGSAPRPLSGSALRKRKRALGTDRRRTAVVNEAESGPPAFGATDIASVRPDVSFDDIGGIDDVLQDLEELVHYPLLHPEIYEHLGVDTPCGILLHGPSGVGKTMLARAVAGEYNVPFYQIAAPEIVSGMSGESEAKIRDIFEKAKATSPSIIFIDEIDAISPKRDVAQREMERRIVAQLLASMDSLQSRARKAAAVVDAQREAIVEAATTGNGEAPVKEIRPLVIVIGATNRADAIDPALRRAGRFDREIAVPIPSERARGQILELYAKRLRLDNDVDIALLARLSPGYVGADLQALCKEAAIGAINRIFSQLSHDESEHADDAASASTAAPALTDRERAKQLLAARAATSAHLKSRITPLSDEELEPLAITMADFHVALKRVQPSARREGFAVKPNVSWDDVGALEDVRSELEMALVKPILQPELFEQLGIATPAGILLYGPPGCGKCLARDTPVLMHSGAVKPVQDVRPGERLMGDDSTPRAVLSTTRGREQMAEIAFAASEPFRCNVSHVLSLKLTDSPAVRCRNASFVLEWFDAPRHADGTVAALTPRSRSFKSAAAAQKFATRLHAHEPLAIGADETVDIAVKDLLDEKHVAASTLEMLRAYRVGVVDFPEQAFEPADAWRVGFELAGPLSTVYRLGSRQTRLQLLAGVCDARASIRGSHVEIVLPNAVVRDHVAFVARSLGFLVTAKCNDHIIVLHGDGSTVPTTRVQLPRRKSVLRERFSVRLLAEDDYYGFELGGNHRFVLAHNFVVTHNTLLAKAIANQAGANFISVKGPELLDKYVGESERAVRQVFARAAAASPCIIFFDELDALCGRRQGDGGNQAGERVVNQLLTEMDGVGERRAIYVVGATNRPDMIDAAMLRPGRLDKLLYVPLPDAKGRASILHAATRKTPLAPDVDLVLVGADERSVGFSGADLASLVREAAIAALRESFDTGAVGGAVVVAARHFDAAYGKVQPSVSRADEKLYDRMRSRLRVSRAASATAAPAQAPSKADDAAEAMPLN